MKMNLSHEDAVMLWNDVVEMAHDCDDPSMLPWLERLTPVSLENSVMTVSTRQNWTVKKIVGEYQPTIEALLRDITLEPISLQVVVASAVAASDGETPRTSAEDTAFHVKHSTSQAPAAAAAGTPACGSAPDADPAAASIPTAASTPSPSAAALAGAAVAAGRTGLFSSGTPRISRPIPADGAAAPAMSPEPASAASPEPAAFPNPPVSSATPAPTAPSGAAAETTAGAGAQAEPNAAVEFTAITEPETVAQDAVVPILEDGTIPKAAVSSGYSDFSFDTYIVGESNNLAFSMAKAVAEQPGGTSNLNPLFIWGPSGNGKTHLLLSIVNYLRVHQPNMNVQYVPANAFVDQYIDDLRRKRSGSEVLKDYRDVEVLLVDDVQFLENKQQSVTTFFDIFNQLISKGKQIVLAADTPPDYLNLDNRVRSRFGSGVVIDIKAPTYEMKRSILLSYYERCRQRMDWCDVEIPPKLFDTITELAPNNPRSMQGLITSIIIKASDNPDVLTSEGIKKTISELFKSTEAVSIGSIIRKVCEAYDVTVEDVRGKSRTKTISEARQVVMWMARQLTDESYETIGTELGGRDHSTVYYSIGKVEERLTEDKSYLYKLDRLKKEIVG